MGFENTRFMQELYKDDEMLDLILTEFKTIDDFTSNIYNTELFDIQDITTNTAVKHLWVRDDVELYFVSGFMKFILTIFETDVFANFRKKLNGSTLFIDTGNIYFSDTPLYNVFEMDLPFEFSLDTFINSFSILNSDTLEPILDTNCIFIYISFCYSRDFTEFYIALDLSDDYYNYFINILDNFEYYYNNYFDAYMSIGFKRDTDQFGEISKILNNHYSEYLQNKSIGFYSIDSRLSDLEIKNHFDLN